MEWSNRERFDRPVTVGIIYMLKLNHLVEDKLMRDQQDLQSVTQQPLGETIRGSKIYEMEVPH